MKAFFARLTQPQVIILIIMFVTQILTRFGVVVPTDVVQLVIDLVTVLTGGVVAYKSDKDSII